MNKLSRLTALLLALIMLLGSVSLAEGGLPIGGSSGLTSDDWADLVDTAEDKLFYTDEGDTGKEITPEAPEQPEKPAFYPYTDIEELTLIQNEMAAEASITASGAAILTHEAAGQWQIAIGGVWANLYGETDSTLTVTGAMMNGRTSAEIRKALGDKNAETGEYVAYTQTAVINLIEAAPAMFSVSRDATDMVASDANDGIMTLEMANQENMVIVQVIYRIKDTDQPVADAYIGQIAKGSALNTSLTLPRVTGYLARACTVVPAILVDKNITTFTEQTADTAGSLTINVTQEVSQQDITIYVDYEPAEVTFTVKHMRQKVENDEYELYAEELLTGKTGEQVGDKLAKTYEGFSAIWYDPTTAIAADGSTVVEIRYNREYYLLTFDLGGGYGVEPIFAKFGTPVGVEDPLRAGYDFAGWVDKTGNEATIPENMPAHDTELVAHWIAMNTAYTVVYWRADVDDGDETTPITYSYWGYETVEAKSGDELTPSEVGEKYPAADVEMIAKDNEAGYFTYDTDATKEKNIDKKTGKEKIAIVAGDGTTVVNVYYSRNKYTIRFIYTRKNGDLYYFASSTGCGTYNNKNHSDSYHTSTGNEEKKINWTYYSKETPVVSEGLTTGNFDEVDGTTTYTYYYISLTAEYGANLEEVWPAAPLNKVEDKYDFGSWAAQCGSSYRKKYGNEHSNIVGAYPVMSSDLIMDPANKIAQTMVAWWGASAANVSAHTYHVYFQALPDENVNTTYEGIDYVGPKDISFTCAHNTNTRVDPFAYDGFECVNDTRVNKPDYQANSSNYKKGSAQYKCPYQTCEYCQVFYYTRNTYTLSFFNYNEQSEAPASESLMYGESFTNSNPGEPKYPVGVEPGSMCFVGWYTTPEAFDGTAVDWENSAMPASDLTFYAKWESVTHDVQFWIDADKTTKVMEYLDVTHRMSVTDAYSDAEDYEDPQEWMNEHPSLAEKYKLYNFTGWYFIDEDGTENRFDIKNTPVKADMDIYAKWTSDTPVEFTFKYQDEKGNQLAEDYTGLALPFTPVTMSAKVGTDLTMAPANEDPMRYIPAVSSHTLNIDVDPTKNVFVFTYSLPGTVEYTVQYLAAKTEVIDGKTVLVPIMENGAPKALVTEKTVKTEKAVVTESYEPVKGYVPQATQLRLIVSTDEENVIQFLYLPNETDEYYNATHIIVDHNNQKTEYFSEKGKKGTIGKLVTVNKQDITGYTFSSAEVVQTSYNDTAQQWVTETVTADKTDGDKVQHRLTDGGMHVYLYYEPVLYPVIVRHLKAGTTDTLLPDEEIMKAYGSTLNAENFAAVDEVNKIQDVDYRVSSYDPLTHTVKVDDGTALAENVIIIYYEPDVADITISKKITESEEKNAPDLPEEEWDDPFVFTVMLKDEAGKALKTVSVSFNGGEVKNETLADGVLTFPLQNDHWMTIHDLPVGTKYKVQEQDTGKFKISYSCNAEDTLTMLDVDMIVTNMYPKYAGELIVEKSGLAENESAIVKADVGGVVYYLVLNKTNGYTATISGIKPGTSYNVSEVTNWTWQYSSTITGGSGTITEQSTTAKVVITNTRTTDKWLHDESHVENDFGTGQSTGVNQ